MLEVVAYILIATRIINILTYWWAAGKHYTATYQVKDAIYATITGGAIIWLLIKAYVS